jgi:hypothetical protein
LLKLIHSYLPSIPLQVVGTHFARLNVTRQFGQDFVTDLGMNFNPTTDTARRRVDTNVQVSVENHCWHIRNCSLIDNYVLK